MFARSREWTTLLPLRKTLSALHFQLHRLRSSMSCIVQDTELTDNNVQKELGDFFDCILLGYSFCARKNYKLTKQAFWCTRNLHRIVWISGRLGYSELSNAFPMAVKGEYNEEGTKIFKILGNLLDVEVENLEDHGCPKVQDLVDEENWICWSYLFRHKTTLHCAGHMAKLFGNWIMWHLI